MANRIKMAEGSIQDVEDIPEDLQAVYRTAWEVPMRSLIDMAAERGAFIDQSQSLNLFMESPTIGKLSLDVPPRLEVGPQDHLLPAVPPGHPHQQDHHRRCPTPRAVSRPGEAKAFTEAEAVACSLGEPRVL